MHGNLLMRCDTCPNWCDRRNEEIGGQRKDFWCEEMKRIYRKIGLKISWGLISENMPWDNLMIMLMYVFKGEIMSRQRK